MIILTICVLNSSSQEFGTHWISHPLPNDSSEVLFCKEYITSQKPQRAYISFATCGKIKVFFNERNITQDIYFCNSDTSTIEIYTYDVTNYLQPDSNTIAVWYAPLKDSEPSKQLSLEYYGYNANRKAFYHQADEKWKCLILNGCYIKEDKEYFDARKYTYDWKAGSHNRGDWLTPLGAHNASRTYTTSINKYPGRPIRLSSVLLATDTLCTATNCEYSFDRVFTGTSRITLRGAKNGEIITVNNLVYTCNGEMDEQAFLHFSTSTQSKVVIQGDSAFKKSQITHVEGLEY